MKILQLTKKYPRLMGGDAYAVYNFRKQYEKAGHQVEVVVSNCNEIDDKGVFKFGLRETSFNLDRITPRRIVSLIFLSLWGLKNLRKIRPDVIHSHSADLGFFISIIARFYGIPVVNTCHGVSFNDKQYFFIKRAAERFFLKYGGFKKIIAVDIKGLEALKEANIRNAVYVPNGIDIHRFRNGNKIGNPYTKFLFVGRLEKQKGLIYLINAANILKYRTDFEIIIVGEGSESGYLIKTAQESDQRDRIKFKGRVDDRMLTEYYLKSDVFVLPSLWEGMPLTMFEAAASGMPIIASDAGGISSMFVHEESALIVEQKSSAALADAMVKLMDDKKLREKLGGNARKIVKDFSWENTAGTLYKIYTEAAKI